MHPSGKSISSASRPPSSHSSRPSSSLSATRPISSLSAPRPISRISHSRPPSSLTARPPSAGSSYRPNSRFSNRPPSRIARSWLTQKYQILVTQVTGLAEDGPDGEQVKSLLEFVHRQLEPTTINKASASVDMGLIDRAISGHSLKARVNLQDNVSKSLEHCHERLKALAEKQDNDLDSEIKNNRLPDYLQLLIALSQPPSASTMEHADLYLDHTNAPPPKPLSLTWADILAGDPFEGEHWEGILDPICSLDHDWDSTPSLSPLNSDDLALDGDSLSASPLPRGSCHLESSASSPRTVSNQINPTRNPALFQDLTDRQYWRKEWQIDADPSRPFNLGDPSTLGPTINRATAVAKSSYFAQSIPPEKYINEEDMVREVLMALQGCDNIALLLVHGRYFTRPTPRLIHLSLESQSSILESFATTATILQSLRTFTNAIFTSCWGSSSQANVATGAQRMTSFTRTSEAFADAVDQEVRDFDAWCSFREEKICFAGQGRTKGPFVASLLETHSALSDEYDIAFDAIHEIIQSVFDMSNSNSNATEGDDKSEATAVRMKRSPSAHSTFLLDTIFSTLQEHTERRLLVVSRMLMRIFTRTAEPIWDMVGKWLRDGMNIRIGSHGEKISDLEEEFFIESSGVGIGMMNMGLSDPDFWKEGYCLREHVFSYVDDQGGLDESVGLDEGRRRRRRQLVPSFLKHVADPVLETGKAIGLIRVLGLAQPSQGFSNWLSFADVISSSLEGRDDGAVLDRLSTLFSVSVDSLSRVVSDRLWPVCESTRDSLVKIIVVDCELWRHVNAVEDLYLMRKGDTLGHFIDLVFSKMDSSQSWSDFHFLNTAFGDVVHSTSKGVEEWIQLSLVRLSYRAHRDVEKEVNRTIKAIEGLQVEYAVPFPLTYIFRPEVIQKYSEIFVLLLQIRRAKHVLERILVRGDSGRGHRFREELKVFYAMRSRLSWFVNTLLTFLTTYALRVQLLEFHEALESARSLDEIIHIHDRHLEKMQARCLLTSNDAIIHRSIISILDMCIHFSQIFVSYAGDTTTTHDVSRVSITFKHHSRRQKRQCRNVIGFSQFLAISSVLSSDEDEPEEEFDAEGNSGMRESSISVSVNEEVTVFERVEQLSTELDGAVRFVRRGIESIAGGTGEAASSFGVFAFALEDWDI